jgi:hypothetical protein
MKSNPTDGAVPSLATLLSAGKLAELRFVEKALGRMQDGTHGLLPAHRRGEPGGEELGELPQAAVRDERRGDLRVGDRAAGLRCVIVAGRERSSACQRDVDRLGAPLGQLFAEPHSGAEVEVLELAVGGLAMER